MLQKLLASKNAEDLRAANRLIRDMVRRDEKRMHKLQQRLEDVDLIQNNVKLLNELLSHYKDTSGEGGGGLSKEGGRGRVLKCGLAHTFYLTDGEIRNYGGACSPPKFTLTFPNKIDKSCKHPCLKCNKSTCGLVRWG